jgi:hypothetical protein
MSSAPQHPTVALLRERSLWTDSKGRKLLVWRIWREQVGIGYVPSSLDLLMLDELAYVNRPYNELVALINDGRMVYDRDVMEKIIKLPSGVVPHLAGAEN